jgi:hypothetical protein
MGKASVFNLPPGSHVEPGGVRGYYIDFSEKAPSPDWPPWWFPYPGFHRFMAVGQWALGAYERHLAGEGDGWLAGALRAGEHLVEQQVRGGPREGGWLEPNDYPHTLRMRGPWLSAMAQGHCASLLVRLHAATRRADFAESARRALLPYDVPTSEGGVQARLDDGPFPEEYPTTPPSFVLNGAIYAIWGLYDVWVGLDDDRAGRAFHEAVGTLASSISRWDVGFWSRYDLYPHPGLLNVASANYHRLHVNQLRALDQLADHPEFGMAAERFARYAQRRRNRWLAFVTKGLFRLLVPRNHVLAGRLPWEHPPHGWEPSVAQAERRGP